MIQTSLQQDQLEEVKRRTVSELMAKFRAVGLWVIGEDEELPAMNYKVNAANELRAKQRERLDQITKQELLD